MYEYATRPSTEKDVHVLIHSGGHAVRHGPCHRHSLPASKAVSCMAYADVWRTHRRDTARKLSGKRRGREPTQCSAFGFPHDRPHLILLLPQVSPERYMDIISALRPDLYVTLADEASEALRSE
jgi:hypothetical protein